MSFDFDLDAFIRNKVTKRPVSLLAEDYARYGREMSRRLEGRRVLVIGGAGSIGSHYIKAVLRYPIASLCVVDINENGLTELVRDLRSDGTYRLPPEFVTYPVNFNDTVFEKIFRARGPFDVVANFAAHKHVRSEKDIFSIEAMIENNLLRARGLLETLREHKPEAFFCVSTDKAANPVNIMGASKKLMEEMIMAYAGELPVKTARFANVAFSNGSLPLGFLERLRKRQPWSCPRGIRRFFVSPIESGELCLMASILGESGDILFPKLDPARDMITFEQVARDLLDALGLGIDECASEDEARAKCRALLAEPRLPGKVKWPVYFFDSDTSGEKPYEEFFVSGEKLDLARFARLGVIKNAPRLTLDKIDEIFDAVCAALAREGETKAELVSVLEQYVPNFRHIETGKSLDQKM